MRARRPFVVQDVLTSVEVRFNAGERVEFEVEPPIVNGPADRGGGSFRLIPEEGRITVTSEDHGIYVSGRHAISIEPDGANGVTIRLRDSVERTEVEPEAPDHAHPGGGPCGYVSCDLSGPHDHWPSGHVTRRLL